MSHRGWRDLVPRATSDGGWEGAVGWWGPDTVLSDNNTSLDKPRHSAYSPPNTSPTKEVSVNILRYSLHQYWEQFASATSKHTELISSFSSIGQSLSLKYVTGKASKGKAPQRKTLSLSFHSVLKRLARRGCRFAKGK